MFGGNVLKLLNRHEEAIDAYGTAIRLRPGYAKAMFNLGNALNETGRTQSAVDAYRAALALKPDWPDALMNLGNALTDLDQSEQALATYHRAAELDPARRELQASLAGVYSSMGHITLARKHFAAASAGRESLVSRLRQATLAAPIPPDEGAIEQFRASLSTAINRLAEECAGQKVDVASLHKSGAEPPMLLAYDARENREIRSAYAGLFRGLLNSDPPLPLTSAPHIGFVVTRGHEGVFFKCMGGIVNRWPANAPRLSLVCTRSGRNILSQWVHNPKVGFIVLPERLPDAAEAIREAGVHLLHYWEVGTDSTNYFLPMLRPAPVQTATWGWPVTTGLPDCFSAYVSSQKLEPVDGAQHYAEQLVMLPSLPTCYARPPAPARRAPKSDFGLSTGQRLYVCPQNLRKILPSFDAVLTELLRQDASGVLMFIADAQPSITTMFRSRIDAAAGDVADRVRIAARLRVGAPTVVVEDVDARRLTLEGSDIAVERRRTVLTRTVRCALALERRVAAARLARLAGARHLIGVTAPRGEVFVHVLAARAFIGRRGASHGEKQTTQARSHTARIAHEHGMRRLDPRRMRPRRGAALRTGSFSSPGVIVRLRADTTPGRAHGSRQ